MAGRHALKRIEMTAASGAPVRVPEHMVEEYGRRGFRVVSTDSPTRATPAKKAAPRKRAAKKSE